MACHGEDAACRRPRLSRFRTVAREWGRLGLIGFGGPPTHIVLMRRLCVERRGWIPADEFEDAIAACNLLPGPSSTQLAIYCVGGWRGALVGGAGAGGGSAVAAVAVRAALDLAIPSWERAAGAARRLRWVVYAAAGGVSAALAGPYVVLALAACGGVEVFIRLGRPGSMSLAAAPHAAGLGSLVWTALKVGALSFGGGFVIIPLMQSDAVSRYHWMTGPQFLDAVALGQVTPGPVAGTAAAVGYAAGGVGAALLAALVAFSPSFTFVLIGRSRFDRLRGNAARALLAGEAALAAGAHIPG